MYNSSFAKLRISQIMSPQTIDEHHMLLLVHPIYQTVLLVYSPTPLSRQIITQGFYLSCSIIRMFFQLK